MGYARVIRDANGDWVSCISGYVDNGSAFLAELLAIEKGLCHAWDLGYRVVVCYSDCCDVVDIFNHNVQTEDYWDREVILRIRNLLSKAWSVSLRLISREKNCAADELARHAAIHKSPNHIWRLPPSNVVPLLCFDVLV